MQLGVFYYFSPRCFLCRLGKCFVLTKTALQNKL